MKTPILLAVCAAFAAPAFSQYGPGVSGDFKASWHGAATFKTKSKSDKAADLTAVYPVFGDARPVALVAGRVLKNDAIRSFNAFDKQVREDAKDPDLRSSSKYEFEISPTLVLNRARLIGVTTRLHQYTGGAHGASKTRGYVFGAPPGAQQPRQLHLADFFSDGNAARRRVNALLMRHLSATKGQRQEASSVLSGEVQSVTGEQMENFVAGKDGLTWYFGEYEMGPYSAGEFQIKLSARELGSTFRAGLLR